MRRALEELIEAYWLHAERACQLLRREFPEETLLQGWKAGRITERGTLTNGQTYRFHGCGCRLTGGEALSIELELNADGGIAGFDAWRLFHFARQLPGNTESFQGLTVELAQLNATGELTNNLHDSPHLFERPARINAAKRTP